MKNRSLFIPPHIMNSMIRGLIICAFCVQGFPLWAQFQLNGSATQLDSLCVRLTPAQATQSGSMWNLTQFNLDSSFTLELDLFFGCSNVPGADGLVFGLQPISTSVGTAGGGMGFGGIAPSLGIEFDTYPNTDFGDPIYDHVAIVKNGDNNHLTGNTISGPIQCNPTNNNIEDCNYHEVRITWDAALKKMEVYWECQLRLSLTEDIVNTIFFGDPMVFWGFTAATGGEVNDQRVCLKYASLLQPMADQTVCLGNSVPMYAPAPGAESITWTPFTGLSNANVANPICTPTATTTYYVTCQLSCSTQLYDTVTITVTELDVQINQDDQSLCPGDALTLDVDAPNGSTFSWSTGSNAASITVSDSDTYIVTATENGCDGTDSIIIYQLPAPNTVLGSDLSQCEGDTVIFTIANPIDVSILWSNGSTDTIVTITESETLSLTMTSLSSNCSTTDEVNILFADSPAPDPFDTIVCEGTLVLLDATYPDATYLWSDSTTGPTYLATEAGTYTVTVSLADCSGEANIGVIYTYPPFVNFPEDTVLCLGGFLRLSAGGDNAQFIWQDGSKDSIYIVTAAGLYGVVAQNDCGTLIEEVIVNVEDCTRLYIPNVFSPNDDGINEGFGPSYSSNVQRVERMTIFDRWGNKIYENRNFVPGNPQAEWNGFFRGEPAPSAVYAYIIDVLFRDNTVGHFAGTVTLVR